MMNCTRYDSLFASRSRRADFVKIDVQVVNMNPRRFGDLLDMYLASN